MSEQSVSPNRPQSSPYHPPAEKSKALANMGGLDRVASIAGGCALALYGLRRSVGHIALMIGGGALVYRGLKGHCPLYESMGMNTLDEPSGTRHSEIPPGP
jgi:uncharacterized membrane protein